MIFYHWILKGFLFPLISLNLISQMSLSQYPLIIQALLVQPGKDTVVCTGHLTNIETLAIFFYFLSTICSQVKPGCWNLPGIWISCTNIYTE